MSILSYSQQEKLEVSGAIQIGNSSSSPLPGTLRFNSATSDFEGWNGYFWATLTGFSTGVVMDVDNNSYKTVKIGLQEWMAENVKVTQYANTAQIGDGTGLGDIGNDFVSPLMFDYNDNPTNTISYGKLYTWAAAMKGSASSNSNPSGIQGVCPSGWHLPSNVEWNQLILFLDTLAQTGASFTGAQSTTAGAKLKEKGTVHWNSETPETTNVTAFTGLPGGGRLSFGLYLGLRTDAGWWSATDFSASEAWQLSLSNGSNNVNRGHDFNKALALSVRCVKD